MRRVELMGMVLLLLLILGLSASAALSSPHPQPPLPPGLQLAPKRPAILKPPPPRTGFIPSSMDLSHLRGQGMPAVARVGLLPAFDWRTDGKVTPVGDQGDCGSCYAFAAIGNFESKMLIDGAATLPDLDYSENHAKECNWREIYNYESPPGVPWGSCDGGNYDMLAGLWSQEGVVLDTCNPYEPSDVACDSSCAYQKTLLDWRIISGGVVPDTEVLKNYIYTYGPVYTSLYASFPGFNTYAGTGTLYYDGPGDPNHAVLIVGWDDSLTHAGPGSGGWIVKNSWGTGWGGPCGYGTEGGYFTIAYGSAGIGKYSSFVYGWQDYDPTGGMMKYDHDGGSENAVGFSGTTTAWGLAALSPVSDTNVTRVEFWTSDRTTDVDVYIYDDFDGTTLSNQLRSVEDNSFNEAGYHSVAVAPLPVTSGNDVVAVVKFTNDTLEYPVPLDPNGDIETDRTYISPDGNNWYEMGGYGYDVAIRLRTSAGPPLPEQVYLPVVMKNH